ncbi:site-specific integrase [Aquibacillus albus]|uniref:Integrase n=1 Tax=Aquibacillus albus TaxID=1168171 RepID=A0ABS2N424_9BACI|nr:site-specific integrase [Aquibacillus albus]MBM7572891.1 integrase [Aquibacillus albus]
MASIKKRGKTWQYAVSHTVNGESKLIRKGGFSTQAEAKAAAIELEAKLNKGIVPHLKPAPIDEYFDNWVELYKKGLSEATLKHYKYTSDRIKEHLGSKPLQEITTQDYQEFLNKVGENKSKETVSKLHGHIRACVQDARDEQIIHSDFTRKAILYYTVSAKKEKEKHVNYHDFVLLIKTLLSKVEDDLGYYLLLLALATGMRFAELVGLTFDDFDFDNNQIDINKTWSYNNKKKKIGFGPTKGNDEKNCDRVIDVNKTVMNAFKELFATMPDNDNHLVFYNAKSKYKVITNSHANDLLKETLLDLKIRPLISFHGARHSHGSVLLYEGNKLEYVSERLGHLDIETTYRKYIHLLNEGRESEINLAMKTFEDMFED